MTRRKSYKLVTSDIDNKYELILSDIINDIHNFGRRFSEYLAVLNKQTIKRIHRSKISLADIIYCVGLMLYNEMSYDTINAGMQVENLLHVTKQAIIQRRTTISTNTLEKINQFVLTELYTEKTDKKRYIAVDGSIIHTLKQLHSDGFKICKEGEEYCTVSICCLYDITNKIPISCSLDSSLNERQAFLKQIDLLNPDDTVIFDRGYFSYALLNTLVNKGINVIFRLTDQVGKSLNNTSSDTTIVLNKLQRPRCVFDKIVKFRVIKYERNNKTYYIGTTLLKKPRWFLIDKYNERWSIETHFGDCKKHLSIGLLNGHSRLYLEQDIQISQLLFLLNAYIKLQSIKLQKVPKGHLINQTISLNLNVKYFLKELLYSYQTPPQKGRSSNHCLVSKNTNIIERLVIQLTKPSSLIKTVKGRQYPRVRLRPISKWGHYGKRFDTKSNG